MIESIGFLIVRITKLFKVFSVLFVPLDVEVINFLLALLSWN